MHVQLDAVRAQIVAGRANPQQQGPLQVEQYELSVAACCALARIFATSGYDVAVDDVLEPGPFERHWQPQLRGLDWRLVIVLPALEEVLRRSAAREKRVLAEHTRAQYRASEGWPERYQIDTTGLSVEESVQQAGRALTVPRRPREEPKSRDPGRRPETGPGNPR